MKKSGLQKQISSIFNDAPRPVTAAEATLPTQQDTASVAVEASPASMQKIADASEKKPSLAQRMAESPAEAVHTPAVPTMRPRPLDRTQVAKPKASSKVSGQIKKALSGSGAAKMDPRQKKMTMMVGVLSLVFGVVLFVSLGGLGQSEAAAADNNGSDDAPATVVNDQTSLQWHSPQPLPEQLRNPMAPAAPKTSVAEQTMSTSSDLVVKGIVFSKTNPTAIINERIVAQGESINGITVVTIGKETVEFEKSGERWTQPVQR